MANNDMYNVSFDDGTREITLRNLYGKVICQVHFRPADYSILDRLSRLREDMPEIIKPIIDMDINPDGTAVFEKDWARMKAVEAEVINRMNELFDMDEAAEIFKKRYAFSSIDGQFYCYKVLEILGDMIVSAVEDEMQKSKARMDKYLKDVSEDAGEAAEDA